jgi:DNA-binding NtrC family response regulator
MDRILLIDDDKVTLAVNSRILTDEGYDVHHAYSLGMARQRLVQNDYDLVITDMLMPDAEGSLIVADLKKIRPHSALIVMTAHGTLDMVIECMRAGPWIFCSNLAPASNFWKPPKKPLKKKSCLRRTPCCVCSTR